jgi:hypothetical protein
MGNPCEKRTASVDKMQAEVLTSPYGKSFYVEVLAINNVDGAVFGGE